MQKGPDYLKVVFPVADPTIREVLIALLSEAGFVAFEETPHQLEAFVPVEDVNRPQLEEIAHKWAISIREEVLPAKNWNAQWEADFKPVSVDRFCTIRASFHPPDRETQYDLVITPKMSFGTGHHATTFLMVKAMAEIDFSGKKVLDFGTGTGVLAILAEKVGAARVDAIDYDEWSIDNARENILANRCERIHVYKADHIETEDSYAVILANINKQVILSQLSAIATHLAPAGVLLISGVLDNDRFAVLKALESCKLMVINILEKDGWLLIRSLKP